MTLRPLPQLRPRPKTSHKGDFGHVLLVGGSRGMAGAISIAGMAALRSGAGLVSLAVPDPILDTVATMHPCLMTLSMPSDREGRMNREACQRAVELASKATVIGLGPGMGRSDDLDALVARLYREVTVPMTIDADGLNALAANSALWINAGGPRVLTPHPGEFERLTGVDRKDRRAQTEAAKKLAAERHLVIVLKGFETVITDGDAMILNQTGNAKMAVGGSGDCLTGIITGLMAQGLNPFDAAHLGVALHGAAGDLAAKRLSSPSVLATDLLEELPAAFRLCEIAS